MGFYEACACRQVALRDAIPFRRAELTLFRVIRKTRAIFVLVKRAADGMESAIRRSPRGISGFQTS